jgi:hypothetical protein
MSNDGATSHDPAEYVRVYRAIVAQLELATEDIARAEYQLIANAMRERWRDWNGASELHEVAFGG